ncbi:XRE family transcriptional regulator [Actinomadura violacea]|uniref:XRE family transcriptional regulator n=1 Tax=Actinomadura violacea TaxID=2819934 RepID=A0ABS3S619_9ACTN|nr:XRE family transcriptional regulator [Actinomadura violacea]MBO2464458.1 XRE family transcriptional regulator [Actinomadura violacea]
MKGLRVPLLAERLDKLFTTVHPPGRGPYSYQEAADAITAATGKAITHTALWRLRTGKETNPKIATLTAIAEFFQVPVKYFFDDKAAAEVDKELDTLALLRDSQLDQGHLRAMATLAPQTQELIAGLIIATAAEAASQSN